VGLIGQLLPPGAGATLVRSAAFFDWAGSALALWTLLAWAGIGLVLLAIGRAAIVEPDAAVRSVAEPVNA
jgi:hypothetical protein